MAETTEAGLAPSAQGRPRLALRRAPRADRARAGRRTRAGMLLVLPAFVAVIGLGWLAWRLTAKLDAIEQRQLNWGLLGSLFVQHLQLTLVATIVVLAVALPLGIALTRPALRRFSAPVVAVANMGQAAPVIGIVVLGAIWLGFGFWTAIAALALYAFLPVLSNTIVGLRGVDATLVEASRGLGLSQWQTLLRVELPLAIPVIMTGVRTALVLLVGTATFASLIGAGGLGDLITTGIKLFRYPIVVSGALLVALLALVVDWLGRLLEVAAAPKGLTP